MKKQVSFEAIETETIAAATGNNNVSESVINTFNTESEFDVSEVVSDGEIRSTLK